MAKADSPGWGSGRVVKLAERQVAQVPAIAKGCSGYVGYIEVESMSTGIDACVFGNFGATRVARYKTTGNEFRYAISFSTDVKFFPLNGICEGESRCMYSQSEDTFFQLDGSVLRIVKRFSDAVARVTGGVRSFSVDTSLAHSFALGDYVPNVGAMTLSSNGQWALLELPDHGFIRLNVTLLISKRVIPYNFSGSPPPTDSLFMSISDDGQVAALGGFAPRLYVYEITDMCGDQVYRYGSSSFPADTTLCRASSIATASFYATNASLLRLQFVSEPAGLRITVKVAATVKDMILAPESEPPPGGGLYIAFGDSFTSGEGEEKDEYYEPLTNTNGNKCHVSIRSYPYLIGESWEYQTSNKACSGGRIHDVLQVSSEMPVLTTKPQVISIGVGGNDIDIMSKFKSCLGAGICEWAQIYKRSAVATEMRSLFPRYLELFARFQSQYPGTPLIAFGYPDVVSDSSDCSSITAALLLPEERRFLHEIIQYTNKVMQAAALQTQVTYVDIESAFQGERLCDGSESSMNAVRFGDDIAPLQSIPSLKVIGAESFHPTPRGHKRISLLALERLSSFWENQICTNCVFSDVLLLPSTYWASDIPIESSFRPIGGVFTSLMNDTEKTVHITVPPRTFAEGTTVNIEIHSEPTSLGEYLVGDDGELLVTVRLPSHAHGYHTLHLYGESRSGELIDLYESFYIEESDDAQKNTIQGGSVVYSSGISWTPSNTAGASANKPSHSLLGITSENHEVKGADSFKESVLVKNKNDTYNGVIIVSAILACGTVISIIIWRYIAQRRGG